MHEPHQPGGPCLFGRHATTTLTVIDNAVGPEIVLWSNPLTNAADSVNWTLTFAATNFGPNPMLPAVFPNYVNDATSLAAGPNDFDVTGYPVATQLDAVPLSGHGCQWVEQCVENDGQQEQLSPKRASTSIRKARTSLATTRCGSTCISRCISLPCNNPNIGSAGREFALFGVNHRGTNCNWRTTAPIAAGAGNAPTNSDGQWFAIDAGSGYDNSRRFRRLRLRDPCPTTPTGARLAFSTTRSAIPLRRKTECSSIPL